MPNALDKTKARIRRCMAADQPRFRRRLTEWERAQREGGSDDRRLGSLNRDIDRSAERRAERQRRLPRPTYPPNLPLVERKDEIARAIRENQIVVICGETGSGKSTQLPKICLELGRGVSGLIGHTQPRRIAARSIAGRIAEELNSPLGDVVGYKIRFQDTIGPNAYVKVMTDGILLAETQGDRNLRQYDTIIIDEAHERSLNIDFLLGYLRQLVRRRRDLKLIITSATIDPHHFSEHFGDAPMIEVSGRTYPVDVHYRPLESGDPDEQDRDLPQAILDAVDELSSLDRGVDPGDILIFLPGERDIREIAELLRKHHPTNTEILPLYARLSASEQNRVFQGHRGRRIVLATNVAETSLTVPGIRYVIDPGLARISRYSARSKVQRLPIEAISQASANQRKGRCGRVEAGVCIRLFAEQDYLQRERYTPPEMLRTNLAGVILQMKALGLGRVERFPFLDPLKAGMIRDGYETLEELGAINERGELTKIGVELSRMPIDPRLGRMILQAGEEDCLTEVLIIAAAMSIQDPRERPMDEADRADEKHEPFAQEGSDFLGYLKLWEFYHEQKKHLSWNKLRKCCRENYLSFVRLREWHEIHKQIRTLATQAGMKPNEEPADPERIHKAVLAGLLSNVGVRKERGFEYSGARGLSLNIFPGSCLFKKKPRWIVAAELAETTRLYARCVAKIKPQWVEELAQHLVKRSYSDPYWDGKRGETLAFERVSLWGLELVRRRRVPFGPVDPVIAREMFIHNALVGGDYRTEAAFFDHNSRLREEIARTEAKRRLRDIMADADMQYEFFDTRIPAEVYDGRRFEKWRRRVEKKQPDLLFMTRDDLMRHQPRDVTQDRFPDSLNVDGVSLPLEYELEPGGETDGVTLRVPIEMLNRIPARRMEWLVPGLLRDKLIALIRVLPKEMRRNYVPVPDFADACLDRISFGQGDLCAELGRTLQSMTGLEVPRGAWSTEALPDHLRMNFRVVDENNETLGLARDLEALRMHLSAKSTDEFGDLATSEWSREGIIRWDFGPLPAEIDVGRGDIALKGYPAFVDMGHSVSIRVFDAYETARRSMRAGVRRLFMLHLAGDLDQLAEHLPGIERVRMHYVGLGDAGACDRAINELIADRAFLGDDPDIRDQAGFERRLHEGWEGIWPVATQVSEVVGTILEAHHHVAIMVYGATPPQWDPAIADIRNQLAFLMCGGSFVHTPYQWLVQYPRYLRAVQSRIEKLRDGGHLRDARRAGEIDEFWRRYLHQYQRNIALNTWDEQLDYYRWMVEEMRVSVFAQELKTAIPVSAKKLEAQWGRVRQ